MEGQKRLHQKRTFSALVEEHKQFMLVQNEAEYLQLLQSLTKENEGPGYYEDFYSFLAREGCANHPWTSGLVNPVQPHSGEDFVAYLARSNGIFDSHTISKLRQALEPPKALKSNTPATSGLKLQRNRQSA